VTSSHLLDANALIALTLTDHEHHQRAASWAATADRIALCPIAEGALVRFLLRLGQSQATARALLDGLYANPRCEFWPDAISYRDADLGHVVGHRQVTDAYLAATAAARQARLATFDRALAAAIPAHVALIP
jgi:toxin-antitoxin system PIN domain toxin